MGKIQRLLHAIRPSCGIAVLGCLVLVACAGDPGPHPNLPVLGIQGQFTSKNLCALGASPAFMLSPPPAGTATYRVKMSDVSVLFGSRWQGDVPAHGALISEGALTDLPLPCPAEKQTLTFRVEIMALAADGRPLAYGWNFLQAQAIGTRLNMERDQAKRPQSPPNTPAGQSRPPFFTN